MTWAPKETQRTIYTLLSGDAALIALIGSGKVFDHVPDNTAYPYVVLHITPWNDRGSHNTEGFETEFQITTWYRAPGRGDLKVQDIQARIDTLLHTVDISISGWNTLVLRRTFVDILTDDDGVTKQGIQRFKLLIGDA